MRRVKLVIEYDGTGLCGWQRQDNGPTIQQHVEEALERMLGEFVRITGASRTDAGVHAHGQVAHFPTTTNIPCRGFRRGLNGHLPAAIAVVQAEDVPEDFHARFSARGKHYRYLVLARPDRSPLAARYSWYRPRPLDLRAMQEAATCMEGERDFSAFRAVGCSAKTAVRTVTTVRVSRQEHHIQIDVWGNAFLRNMVRIMAGTLVEVGQGAFTPSQVTDIISNRHRPDAGQTAPAAGLRLMRVYYDQAPVPSDLLDR